MYKGGALMLKGTSQQAAVSLWIYSYQVQTLIIMGMSDYPYPFGQ